MLDALFARDPSRWPVEQTPKGLADRARRFLRQQGWELLEPAPWLNVFVRARREAESLNLMMHTAQTLGLALLIRDCADKISDKDLIVGILTQARITPGLQDEAEGVGLYLINPPDLAQVSVHLARVAARRAAAQARITAADPPEASPPAPPQTAPPPARQAPEARAPAHLDDPKRHLHQLRAAHKHDEAEAFLRTLMTEMPSEAWPKVDMLWLLQRQRRWAEAVALADTVRQDFPDERAGYIVGCFALRQTGAPAAAAAILRDGLARFPEEEWARIEQAAIHEQMGRPDEAITVVRAAHDSAPSEATSRTLARLLRQTNRLSEARLILTEAAPAFTDSPWFVLEDAQLSLAEGQLEAAIARAAHARARFPENSIGYLIGVRALRQAGRLDEAAALQAHSAQRLPDEGWLLPEQARIAVAAGQWETAAKLWLRHQEASGGTATGFLEAANCFQTGGLAQEADDILRRAVDAFPADPTVWTRYAASAESRMDFDAADQRWTDALGRCPPSPDLALRQAMVFSQIGLLRSRLPVTLARLEALVASEPGFAPARWAMARVLRMAGDLAGARAVADAARQRFPQDHAGMIELAETLFAQGESEPAIALLEDAARQFPLEIKVLASLLGLLCQARRFERAEALGARGIERFANRPDIRMILADAAQRRDDLALAVRRWRELASLFPANRIFQQKLAECELTFAAGAQGQTPAAPPPAAVQRGAHADLLESFESLGGTGEGCEFGIVQRLAGAEPLGLLRWATILPHQLLAALAHRFDGVGSKEQTVIDFYQGRLHPEYRAGDSRFGMVMHTFMTTEDTTPERAEQKILLRLSFLKRKMIETLEGGGKICVYKIAERRLDLAEVEAIAGALAAYGENWLLYVYLADAANPAGTVRRAGPRLLLGYIDQFSAIGPGQARAPDMVTWLQICREAAALRMG